MDIENNTDKNRFEITLNEEIAVLDYNIRDGQLYLIHTGVPESMAGQGIGTALAEYGLKYALNNGLKVIVICPFIREYVKQNKNWRQDLSK